MLFRQDLLTSSRPQVQKQVSSLELELLKGILLTFLIPQPRSYMTHQFMNESLFHS